MLQHRESSTNWQREQKEMKRSRGREWEDVSTYFDFRISSTNLHLYF
jgi:hypothetical protein